ncbi:ATP-binding protein [Kitasatospora sp. NPDC001540]|uniref:ATP-binding protein n=1 Tax=Kitasatospora sp. NPDC001540 TaxID=3364014 RepID=UPI0036979477
MAHVRPCLSQLAPADTPDAVGWARRHTAEVLRHRWVPADTIDTARLIVSELLTNAVRHTQADQEVSPYSPLSPACTVALTLQLGGGRLLPQVQDHDSRPSLVKKAGEEAESGRGVFPVEARSERWGYYCPPEPDGKIARSELTVVGRAPGLADDRTKSHGSADSAGGVGRSDEDTPLVVARAPVGLRGL